MTVQRTKNVSTESLRTDTVIPSADLQVSIPRFRQSLSRLVLTPGPLLGHPLDHSATSYTPCPECSQHQQTSRPQDPDWKLWPGLRKGASSRPLKHTLPTRDGPEPVCRLRITAHLEAFQSVKMCDGERCCGTVSKRSGVQVLGV